MLRLPEIEVEPAVIDWHGLPLRFMNPGEVEILVALLRRAAPRRIAEFGINEGRTARLILENVPGITKYLGFDVTRDYRPGRKFQGNEIPDVPGRYVLDDPRFRLSVTPRGTFDVTPADLGNLDAVFIDGDHSRPSVAYDTMLAIQTVRLGGMIVWHDYHEIGTTDVAEVVHELFDLGYPVRQVKGTWFAVMGALLPPGGYLKFPPA